MLQIMNPCKRIVGVLLLKALLASASPARAQDVSPTINYDPSNNLTTVRVALAVSPDLELRFNRRFNGRTPAEVGGWIGFAFGNNTESGSHDLTLSIDLDRLAFRFPDYSSFQLSRELLLQIAAAGSVEGTWDGARFAIGAPERNGIRRFVETIDPPNVADLDRPRVERWSIARTVDYINSFLGENPVAPCNRGRLAVQADELHVYMRRCDDAFDNSDMFAPASRLQLRGLLYVNGSISLDCASKQPCAGMKTRSSANDEWISNDNWTWVRVEMGQGNSESAEKVRNALEHLVMQMKVR